MWGLLRTFSKYANIKELGKLPSDINKHLKVLGDVNIYKSVRGEKAVQTLDLLYKSSRRKIDIQSMDWGQYKEMKVLTSELPKKINSYSLSNILLIMKTCHKLQITDQSLWLSIENAVVSNLHELEERQLYDLISCFNKKKNVNIKFWKDLENIITEVFCPKHNIQSHVVSMVLSTYSKLGLLNDHFLAVLEQQVLRVCLRLDGTESSNILNILVHSSTANQDLIDKLCKQVLLTVYKMDWYSSCTALVCFVRLGKGDHAIEIEKCVLVWLERMDLHLFANLFFAYAKNMPVAIKKDTGRKQFLMDLAEFLKKDQKIWLKEVDEKDVVRILWGLACARIFDEEIWKKCFKLVDWEKMKISREGKMVEEVLKGCDKMGLVQ